MTDNLARFERMARRAAERRRLAEAEERRTAWAEQEQAVRDELRAHQEQFLAGPPNGCTACYMWCRGKFGGWSWTHGHAVTPVMRPWPEADGELVEYCMHPCHGPDGYPLPVIALA